MSEGTEENRDHPIGELEADVITQQEAIPCAGRSLFPRTFF